MSFYIRTSRTSALGSRAPQSHFTLNREHNQARGLVAFYPACGPYARGNLAELTRREPFALSAGGISTVRAFDTQVAYYGSSAAYHDAGAVYRGAGFSAMTVMAWMRCPNGAPGPGSTPYWLTKDGSGNNAGDMSFRLQTNSRFVWVYDQNNGLGIIGASDVSTDQRPHLVVFTFDNSGTPTHRLYVDGLADGTDGTAGSNTIWDHATTPMQIGGILNGNASYSIDDMAIWWVGLWDRKLSAEEVWRLYEPSSRWSLAWQPTRRIFIPEVAGGAAIERSPTAGALTLTGSGAAVALALQFSPTAGALTLTGQSAQVSIATGVSPTAGDLTLTGESPSVATKLDVSPSAQTLTLSGESPVVALALQFSLTAGDLTLTGEDPAVLVSSANDITPNVVTLSLTGESPAVALALQISPTAGDLTLTGEDPAVLVSAAGDVSPNAVTLTLTGESAAVALALQVSPTAADLTLTSTDPSVSVQRNIAPTSQTITLTGESATVALNLVISPTAGTLTLGGSTADIVNTGFVPAPTPEPTGDGGGAGEARGITEYGRRRQRQEQKIGPAIYGPTLPEEEKKPPIISEQAREAAPLEATEEDLLEIQRALDRGEEQLSLLGDRMDEMQENLQELASRRRSSLLLLLAMTEELF